MKHNRSDSDYAYSLTTTCYEMVIRIRAQRVKIHEELDIFLSMQPNPLPGTECDWLNYKDHARMITRQVKRMNKLYKLILYLKFSPGNFDINKPVYANHTQPKTPVQNASDDKTNQ